MKLKLNQGFNITVTDSGEVSVRDTARMVMVLAGYSLKDHGDVFDVFGANVENQATLLVVYDHSADVDSLIAEYGAVLYAPLSDKSLAQMLMNKHRIHLSSIVTHNGNFVGVWKAERLGDYRAEGVADDLSVNGEHLTAVSDSAILAVVQCALQSVGVGRQTFITFDAAGNSSLIYRAPENVPALAAYGLGRTIFPATELDEYILIGAPADVLNAATSKARTQYDEYIRKEQEAKAEADADSHKEEASDSQADASNAGAEQAEAEQQPGKSEQPALVDSTEDNPAEPQATTREQPEQPEQQQPFEPVPEEVAAQDAPAQDNAVAENVEPAAAEEPQQSEQQAPVDPQPVAEQQPADTTGAEPQAAAELAAAE